MVIADIEAELIELCDFEEVGSVSRAKRFITLANQWMFLRPESASNQSSSLAIGKDKIEGLLKRARDYVANNATNSGGSSAAVKFLGVTAGYRR